MTVYLDLILIENIIMNYIIILTTSIICKEKSKHIRFILASTIGAVYSIVQYISNLEIYGYEILKLLLAICMVYISFKAKSFKVLVKQLFIFFLTSFCFGGASYYLLHSEIIQNRAQNISNPIKAAILGGIVGFIIINISFEILKKRLTKKDLIYDIEIFYNSRNKKLKVLLDTGNLLKDPITNIPVIIIEKEKLKGILPGVVLDNSNLMNENMDNMSAEIKSRCNIIPFKSIGKNNGIIMGFRPDFIRVYENDETLEKKAIIGIYNEKISKTNLYSGLIGLNVLDGYTRSGWF